MSNLSLPYPLFDINLIFQDVIFQYELCPCSPY